jgi:FeS assembly protein IscX
MLDLRKRALPGISRKSTFVEEADRMDWDDAEEIAERLSIEHPEVRDPYSLRFTELIKWVANVEGFDGEKEPKTSMEGKLENIVKTWAEYLQ